LADVDLSSIVFVEDLEDGLVLLLINVEVIEAAATTIAIHS